MYLWGYLKGFPRHPSWAFQATKAILEWSNQCRLGGELWETAFSSNLREAFPPKPFNSHFNPPRHQNLEQPAPPYLKRSRSKRLGFSPVIGGTLVGPSSPFVFNSFYQLIWTRFETSFITKSVQKTNFDWKSKTPFYTCVINARTVSECF